MNKFEATLLLNPDLSTQALKSEIEAFKSNIKDINGKIIESEDWSLRDLSYKINNYKKAFYHFFQIEFDSNKLSTMKNNLNQNEKILRYLFIKVDEHQKLPTKIKDEEK